MRVVFVLAVAGLAALPACTEAGRKIAAAEEAVRGALKDPGSAIFSFKDGELIIRSIANPEGEKKA